MGRRRCGPDCWSGIGGRRCLIAEEEPGAAVVVAPVLGHGGVAGRDEAAGAGGGERPVGCSRRRAGPEGGPGAVGYGGGGQ